MPKELDYPLLDLVTSDELHLALLAIVLKRNKVRDPEKFLAAHAIESKVMYKNLKTTDGNQMTAAVVINKAVPIDATTSSSGPGGGGEPAPKNS
jgi:hypothetical protein